MDSEPPNALAFSVSVGSGQHPQVLCPQFVAVFSQHVQTRAILHRPMNFLVKTIVLMVFLGIYSEDSRNLRR